MTRYRCLGDQNYFSLGRQLRFPLRAKVINNYSKWIWHYSAGTSKLTMENSLINKILQGIRFHNIQLKPKRVTYECIWQNSLIIFFFFFAGSFSSLFQLHHLNCHYHKHYRRTVSQFLSELASVVNRNSYQNNVVSSFNQKRSSFKSRKLNDKMFSNHGSQRSIEIPAFHKFLWNFKSIVLSLWMIQEASIFKYVLYCFRSLTYSIQLVCGVP